MQQVQVKRGDPKSPQATALLSASHALMQDLFDPEENHYLEVDELCVPSIHFFLASRDGQTIGCVALANKGAYGEIKSMFVDPDARGLGVAHRLMSAIQQDARAQGLTSVKLETGDKLKSAVALYKAHGFEVCDAFGDYEANTTSLFMSKRLD
ncbi:GNAT family N-acetyltransferase [Shimia litoralis]|uniref:GNAT family N-acetyltransferase n=1 Tax=Shimia litoralis TaxID=420403 RepID=A0A4U7N5H5_9RHOB|nr:GNAT family N-acetyltransferase [Shimia litoralis]TKZ21089.1 GNAT family N-acetyltransferase [Shimia litoralis]